jgi:hypothetical protein
VCVCERERERGTNYKGKRVFEINLFLELLL